MKIHAIIECIKTDRVCSMNFPPDHPNIIKEMCSAIEVVSSQDLSNGQKQFLKEVVNKFINKAYDSRQIKIADTVIDLEKQKESWN